MIESEINFTTLSVDSMTGLWKKWGKNNNDARIFIRLIMFHKLSQIKRYYGWQFNQL